MTKRNPGRANRDQAPPARRELHTSAGRRRVISDIAKEPAIDKALRETLAANPQFGKKANKRGGLPNRTN